MWVDEDQEESVWGGERERATVASVRQQIEARMGASSVLHNGAVEGTKPAKIQEKKSKT